MIEIETLYIKSKWDESWIRTANLAGINRAANFGDGLFETMLWDRDNLRFFDKHIERITGGMKILGLDTAPVDTSELTEFLGQNFPNQRKRVRWNIFRAGEGKYTPASSSVIQTLQLTEFTAAPRTKGKSDISNRIQLYPTIWSSFKTLNALPYVLANLERVERNLDEIILLDHRGFLSEAGASNLFWIKNDRVYTPSLSCSCINGVSRQILKEQLQVHSVTLIEGEFSPHELDTAELVFVSNCTGISYLKKFGSRDYSTVPPAYLEELFD